MDRRIETRGKAAGCYLAKGEEGDRGGVNHCLHTCAKQLDASWDVSDVRVGWSYQKEGVRLEGNLW